MTLSRMHARKRKSPVSRVAPSRRGTGTPLQETEKPFHAKKLPETCPHDALLNTCFPFSVFSVLLFIFFFLRTPD